MKINNFIYSDTNKRYHTFDYYLKHKYGDKVLKISLNAGFTCPNRDGLCGYGGCSFCSEMGSGEYAGSCEDDLLVQYETIKKQMLSKWQTTKFIAYFQAYSNTYDTLDNLKKRYDLFLHKEEVVALAIATRPDCLDVDKINYLNSLTKQKDLYLELGLQTFNDDIAHTFNRGYDSKVFYEVMALLEKTNIKVCVHLINGLPHESKEEMLNNIRILSQMKIHSIKIHMLNILSDAPWSKDYDDDKIPLLTKDEYVTLVVNQLRLLRSDIVVQRLTGDAKKEHLIAPQWTLKKIDVLNSIDKIMALHDYYQGDLYE
ncbi:MAG: TIGR01212 family radical SAM protein [Bacilli bacterium]|jgi:radical SAM protein (TIGR01212 family)|nr:TIGR01212 family radical SAM protein [Bacilli bacterium]